MRVGAVQLSPKVGDFDWNLSKIFEYSEKARKDGVDLVLFPELSLSGYTLDTEVLKRAVDFFEENFERILRLSRNLDMAIVFGTPRIVGGALRNSMVVFKKKREVLFYDKIHLFRNEKEVFESGEDFLVFDFKGVIFGLSVCYENGFPEVSRILAIRGASVILAPFAFGKERERIYEIATRSRALENSAYLIASSTFGKGAMDFIGRTRIVSPSGEVLKELEDGEGLIWIDYDPKLVERYRYVEEGDSHAYFLNRKPEFYRDICRG